MRARTLFAVIALAGCGRIGSVAPVRVEIATTVIDGSEGSAPRVTPEAALVSLARRGPGRWTAFVDPAAAVVVVAEGACPVMVADVDPTDPGGSRFVRLEPLVDVEGERAQAGFGGTLRLQAVPRCAIAERARISWSSETPGEPLTISEDGRSASGRLPSLEEAGIATSDPGIVPVSPRTRGTRTLRLTVVVEGSEPWTRVIAVHAAARATGVPAVAVHSRTYVRGRGLSLIDRPPDSKASVERYSDDVSTFTPDVRGRYRWEANDGGSFSISAGSHALTDLDCGRSDCHAPAESHARQSPMTTIFARSVERPDYVPACAMGCHTVGEPGIDDGGLLGMLASLGAALPAHGEAGAYDALPREVHRLVGVGCTTCHGPGQIPEPGARARIARIDVCASCHDAPPRYGHVAAWRSNSMATGSRANARAHPSVLSAPCAKCHTTEGSLGWSDAPTRAEIGCATCHAPHGERSGPSLTRWRPIADAVTQSLGPGFVEGASRVCVSCHSPDPSFDLPTASAVALVSGAFGLGPGGAPLRTPAPHGKLERGCLSCHGTASVPGLERGSRHGFGVAETVCQGCHAGTEATPADLAVRTAALVARLFPRGFSRGSATQGSAPKTPTDPARWNAALLAGDRAAWAHAGPGAVRLIEATEALARGLPVTAR